MTREPARGGCGACSSKGPNGPPRASRAIRSPARPARVPADLASLESLLPSAPAATPRRSAGARRIPFRLRPHGRIATTISAPSFSAIAQLRARVGGTGGLGLVHQPVDLRSISRATKIAPARWLISKEELTQPVCRQVTFAHDLAKLTPRNCPGCKPGDWTFDWIEITALLESSPRHAALD